MRKYDDEFRRNAVRKVFDGQSVRSVSQEPGVNEGQIHQWKRAALDNGDGIKSGAETSRSRRFEETDSGVGNGERNPKKGGAYFWSGKLKRYALIENRKGCGLC